MSSILQDSKKLEQGRSGDLLVTCSLGIATYPDTANEWEDLITCADQALYRAKHLGRSQVRSAEPAARRSKPDI